MKVRSQLILAFLLLSVVPLAGIVLYSYGSSLAAFRTAVEEESTALAQEMGEQLEAVRGDIDLRLETLTALPMRSLMAGDSAGLKAADVYLDLMTQMGEVAPMVDWLEFSPASESGETFFIYPSKALARSLARLSRLRDRLEESGLAPEYFESAVTEVVRQQSLLKEEEIAALAARGEEMMAVLGSEFVSPVRQGERVVGSLKAVVPATAILREVLSRSPRDEGKVPYARDEAGDLYVDAPSDRRTLLDIGLMADDISDPLAAVDPDWIVVETVDPSSGLTFGVGRPIANSLRGIRGAAVQNFFIGLGMIILSMLGVVWLSSRMTRNLTALALGAERLAAGDLQTRVPIRSKDEFGSLALTINRMAEELSENQVRLLKEARLRKDQEFQQQLLAAENERKSAELEEARQFQLSLLPKRLPRHPEIEVAVSMQTATEVGGDYYDFFPSANGALTAAIGDAAGHGARAGTMVTVVKGLFTAAAGSGDPPIVLSDATRAIKHMDLGRMNMGVALVRLGGGQITLSAAGMPPLFVYRKGAEAVDEIALAGLPLGAMAEVAYDRWQAAASPGDTFLLMTDGFPELVNGEGEPLGYERARAAFAAAAERSADEIIEALEVAAAGWAGAAARQDDMTFMVLKVRSAGRATDA